MHCAEDCPANDGQKEPVLVRDVNQAEWTEWAEVLFERKGKARKRVDSPSRSDRYIEANEGREERNLQEVDHARDFGQLPFAEIADRPSTPPPVPPRTGVMQPPLLALARAFIGPYSIFSYLFAPTRRS
ncbi:hypothetical protein BD779DRAFT_1677530 [Infundibulicybe gibba]|nr:hypothetical protein BD779DRAFT_1677530 [Infundibulicybe gibba]